MLGQDIADGQLVVDLLQFSFVPLSGGGGADDYALQLSWQLEGSVLVSSFQDRQSAPDTWLQAPSQPRNYSAITPSVTLSTAEPVLQWRIAQHAHTRLLPRAVARVAVKPCCSAANIQTPCGPPVLERSYGRP